MVRARLRDDRSTSAAASDALADVYHAHQAVWGLFSDAVDRQRDFLYRVDWDRGARVLAVAKREPRSGTIWNVETKPYGPRLAKGDLLRFSLRANATKRAGGIGGRSDGRRHDVVMDAILRAREANDTIDRSQITQKVGLDWLMNQGSRAGFSIPLREEGDGSTTPQAYVASHRVHEFSKGRGARIRVSGLDFEGILQVEDAITFQRALVEGIGPAKGFGFGLLLVRRA